MKRFTNGLSLMLLSLSMSVTPLALAKNDKHQHQSQGKKVASLPPGLQKKVAKGEPLPPGWQKKLHRGDYLADDYYHRGKVEVPLDKAGNITLDIDGTLIKLHDKTRRILDILND